MACVDFGGELRCITGGHCRTSQEVCAQDAECCNSQCQDGYCAKLEGLGPVSCRLVGEACEQATDCCSYSCFDDGTGFKSCQFLGGCRPYGELCRSVADCCNGVQSCHGQTGSCVLFSGQLVGRCSTITGPKPAGEVCDDRFSGTHDCCGGDDACRPDVLGIERCFGEGFVDCLADGETCEFNAQCCSGLCLQATGGGLVCGRGCLENGLACTSSAECCLGICNAQGVCGPEAGCTPDGQACTANVDCCSGFCDPATGQCAPVGACLELGVSCQTNAQCCSGLCEGGVCSRACLQLGAPCTAHVDCCSGNCDPGTGLCAQDVTPCQDAWQPCQVTADCCGGLECISGRCIVS
jgi:hypothetical protein